MNPTLLHGLSAEEATSLLKSTQIIIKPVQMNIHRDPHPGPFSSRANDELVHFALGIPLYIYCPINFLIIHVLRDCFRALLLMQS